MPTTTIEEKLRYFETMKQFQQELEAKLPALIKITTQKPGAKALIDITNSLIEINPQTAIAVKAAAETLKSLQTAQTKAKDFVGVLKTIGTDMLETQNTVNDFAKGKQVSLDTINQQVDKLDQHTENLIIETNALQKLTLPSISHLQTTVALISKKLDVLSALITSHPEMKQQFPNESKTLDNYFIMVQGYFNVAKETILITKNGVDNLEKTRTDLITQSERVDERLTTISENAINLQVQLENQENTNGAAPVQAPKTPKPSPSSLPSSSYGSRPNQQASREQAQVQAMKASGGVVHPVHNGKPKS